MTTQVYRVYIKATPQAIWDAITKPEWTETLRLPAPRPSTTCARAARYRVIAERGDAGAWGMPERDRRRRGDRGGPAAQARPDVARGLGPGARSRRASRASPGRSTTSEGGVTQADGDPRARGRAEARRRRWRAPTRSAQGGGGWSVDPQRSEDAARDRQLARGLRQAGRGPARAGSRRPVSRAGRAVRCRRRRGSRRPEDGSGTATTAPAARRRGSLLLVARDQEGKAACVGPARVGDRLVDVILLAGGHPALRVADDHRAVDAE